MSLVLDPSTALSWLFADAQSAHGRAVLERVLTSGATVPSNWGLDVADTLQALVARRRIDPAFRDAMLRDLKLLPIETDAETDRVAWTETLRLADLFGLRMREAAYLELARRLNLPLATSDAGLAAAATASNVEVLGHDRPATGPQ